MTAISAENVVVQEDEYDEALKEEDTEEEEDL